MTDKTTTHIAAPDGHRIPVYTWEPATDPTAVVQIFHGLGEHVARYERFASAALAAGYAVCAHDHRGHGPETESLGCFGPENGWGRLVADGRLVFESLQERYPGRDIVLLGHSMGSFIAQSYVMQYGAELRALILSGSSWPNRILARVGRWLARFEAWRLGRTGQSALLDKLGFGDFNKKFEPARTEFDWLSRDPDEVDKYVADPLCGGPYATALWLDLLGGLLEVSNASNLRRIPNELPILITGGGDDPVGGASGMQKLITRYESIGHADVSLRVYADGRHEMLNETNRDEFTTDVLGWIARQLTRRS